KLRRAAQAAADNDRREQEQVATRKKNADYIRFQADTTYRRHAPELASRFPEQAFQEYMSRWMSDTTPADLVQERGVKLLALLQRMLLAVEVHRQDPSLHARREARRIVQDYYDQNAALLAAKVPSPLFRAELERRIPEKTNVESAWQNA